MGVVHVSWADGCCCMPSVFFVLFRLSFLRCVVAETGFSGLVNGLVQLLVMFLNSAVGRLAGRYIKTVPYMNAKTRIYKFLSTERWTDSAVFFMRIFVGIMMLVHGIGKINNYEMLFATFPDPLGIGSAASLVLIIGAETVCSLLLIVGLFVRPAALVLAMGMFVASFLAVPGAPFAAHELSFVYMGMYIMLVISGGMRYSLDRVLFRIQ